MKKLVSRLGIMLLLLIGFAPAMANAQEKEDGWKFSAGTVLWMPSIETTASSSGTTVEGKLSFSDILKKLDGGLQGEIMARYQKLSISLDSLNYYLSEDLPAQNGSGDRSVNMSMNWLQGLVGYRIFETSVGETGKLAFEPTVGYREYWNRIQIDRIGGGEATDTHPRWGDVVFGGRMLYALNEKYALIGSGTYGGFGWGDSSKHSWTAFAGGDWNFAKNKSLRLGYLIVDVKKEKDLNGTHPVSLDMKQSGPLISMLWHF